MKLSKPWLNTEEYRRERILETKYDTKLALKFLEAGLYRNAKEKKESGAGAGI